MARAFDQTCADSKDVFVGELFWSIRATVSAETVTTSSCEVISCERATEGVSRGCVCAVQYASTNRRIRRLVSAAAENEFYYGADVLCVAGANRTRADRQRVVSATSGRAADSRAPSSSKPLRRR